MKKAFLTLLCALGTIQAAHAQSVTLKIDAGSLDNQGGTAVVPTGGLLQLIASPTGTFGNPTSSSYVSGDNVLVASFAMNMNGDTGSATGETFNTLTSLPLMNTSGAVVESNYTLGGNYTLSTSEDLELRFYPSLTYASPPTTPPASTTFGQVRSDTIEFGSAGKVPTETAWVVPSAGSTVTFEYVTISNGGTYANSTAFASGTVVPEPSTVVPLAGLMAGVLVLRLRQRRATQGFTTTQQL